VLRDDQGRVLLVRSPDEPPVGVTWWLPGGGVEHGEHPVAALGREVLEETGYTCRVGALRDVLSDVVDLDSPPVAMHSVRLVYEASITGGGLSDEVGGSTQAAAWLTLAQTREVRLAPMLREVVLSLA
jgi:ADP-ribose pyrophosphatase YjhB (NUDIX family)